MAKKTETTPQKKQYTYVIKTTKPLVEGKTYQMTFVDKRTIKQEGEV